VIVGGRLYDDEAVQGIPLRPAVEERELARACPPAVFGVFGVFVVRLPRTAHASSLTASGTRPVAGQVSRGSRRFATAGTLLTRTR
jgi:hypothetical protein